MFRYTKLLISMNFSKSICETTFSPAPVPVIVPVRSLSALSARPSQTFPMPREPGAFPFSFSAKASTAAIILASSAFVLSVYSKMAMIFSAPEIL